MDRVTIPLFALFAVLPFYIPQLWFLDFFAFLPLFVRKDFLTHLRFGFVYGFFTYLFVLKALFTLTDNVPLIVLLFLAFSAIYALIQFGISYILNRFRIFYPLAFTSVEIMRLYFPFNGFPYEYLGKVLVNIPFLSLSLHHITVFGATFFILTVNWLLFKIFEKWEENVSRYLFALTGIFSLLLFLSVVYKVSLRVPHYGIKVALIQPFLDTRDKLQNEEFVKLYTVHLLSLVSPKRVDLIFLPETAIPNGDIDKFIKTFSDYNLMFGTSIVNFDAIKKRWVAKNLVVFAEKGTVKGVYEKIIPLPFGEYTPKPFKWLANYIPYLGYIDYEAGKRDILFSFQGLKILPRICNEVYFPIKISKDVDIIAVFSNDAWFGLNFARRHLWEVKVKAIETGKVFLFVNNNGFSGIVYPDGSYIGYPFKRVQFLSL